MARLIVKDADGERAVELTLGEAVKIGRDAGNEIPLPNETKASRRHCQILGVKVGDAIRYELVDLGSTNKTRVSGKPVERKVLSDGDVIQIGVAEIRFEDETERSQLEAAGSQGICYVEWATKERKGEKVWLRGPRTTLGRRESSTIVLDDRMASGHHAEIVKDLNGYTIRDLGSTNGTLVNGEPTSEAALSHGHRIRIGNCRFVFKDPSMKDVEVELAQFDDDDGWGMMGEMDLARARGSSLGLWACLLLLVGAAGAGAWYFSQADAQTEVAGPTDANLIGDPNFSDADALHWSISSEQDRERARLSVVKGQGLRLAVEGSADGGTPSAPAGPVRAHYEQVFPGFAKRPYRLTGRVRGDEGTGLLAIWSQASVAHRAALQQVVELPLVDGRLDVVLVRPAWAEHLGLALSALPGGTVTLGNVRLERLSEGDESAELLAVAVPGEGGRTLAAHVDPSFGTLALVEGLQPRFVGAAPLAKSADGRLWRRFRVEEVSSSNGVTLVKGRFHDYDEPLAGQVEWGAAGGDSLGAKVSVPKAVQVGLSISLAKRILADGVRVLLPTGPQSLVVEAGARAAGARKVLAGGTHEGIDELVTWAAYDGTSPLAEVVLAESTDPSWIDLQLFQSGEQGGFATTVDYGPSDQLARRRLQSITTTLDERPFDAVRDLRSLAQEFPFNDYVRDEALRLATAREAALGQALDQAVAALRAHEIFGSDDTMARAQTAAAGPVAAAASEAAATHPLGVRARELAERLEQLRAAHLAGKAESHLRRIERLARLLEGQAGFEPVAALYWRAVAEQYGDATDPAMAARVALARERLARIESEHADALLPVPPAGRR